MVFVVQYLLMLVMYQSKQIVLLMPVIFLHEFVHILIKKKKEKLKRINFG